MKFVSARYDKFEFDFPRISVILGANGSGKSKLLTELKDAASLLTGGGKAIYIEGGRTIKLKDVLQLDHTNVGHFDRLDAALVHYANKRHQSLADRVFDALVVLDKREARHKALHSDQVDRWIKAGQQGDCPVRTQPPLERLFELFNESFPQIVLTYDSDGRRLTAQKGGQNYGPSSLSDGEKQVFSILADLAEFEDAHRLVVVDEPELNLHPELAERVWTLIENEFHDRTFIYSTHSINFALRENVQKVYVLSSGAADIAEFTGLDGLPRDEVTAFLGAVPGILSANRVLITEGHEKSFDAIFYRWLLGDSKIEIFPGGGCGDVVRIATKSGLWNHISTKVRLGGVIDADYRADAYNASQASANVHLLSLHEAESFLCHPDIICAVAARIGSQETSLTPEEVVEKAVAMLRRDILSIAARRVFAQSQLALAVSVERRIVAGVSTRDEMVAAIKKAANDEVQKAEETISATQMEQLFDQEMKRLETVLATPKIIEVLRYLPAKELLATLAPRAGCRSGTDVMRTLRRHFKPEEFLVTKELAAHLQKVVAL
ncbi:MAG: AAA family ATPase [Gemmatimonadales bacterium]